MEVTKDRGDHSNMLFEEMEEYQELLRQLELTSKEESDDSFEHMS